MAAHCITNIGRVVIFLASQCGHLCVLLKLRRSLIGPAAKLCNSPQYFEESDAGVGVATSGVAVPTRRVGVATSGVGAATSGVAVPTERVGVATDGVATPTARIGIATAGVPVAATGAGPDKAGVSKTTARVVIPGRRVGDAARGVGNPGDGDGIAGVGEGGAYSGKSNPPQQRGARSFENKAANVRAHQNARAFSTPIAFAYGEVCNPRTNVS